MGKPVLIGKNVETDQLVYIEHGSDPLSTYTIGKSRMGKSTMLETIAYSDITNGSGLCFLDPHEDSAEKLLLCVPEHRQQDVIFWDPADIDRPFGLNPFYCHDPTDLLAVTSKADNFVAALGGLEEFSKIFETAPRMKNLLHHLAITFVVNQGNTLAETPEFLDPDNQAYREQFYPALAEHYPSVLRYWQRHDAKSKRAQEEIVGSSLNKLERFQSNPVMWGIFGQPSNSIDFRKAMDEGKIIIAKLSSQKLGNDNAAFIGAFIVWELLQAALSRSDIPKADRRPFHIIADEFQSFMSTAFPTLQTEGGKHGVYTTVAHQTRAQLNDKTKATTLTGGHFICFRVAHHDGTGVAGAFDTTPPEPIVIGQKPKLEFSKDPWGELMRVQHSNPVVQRAVERLFDLTESAQALNDELTFANLVAGWPPDLSRAGGRWLNPYLYACERGSEEDKLLKQAMEGWERICFRYVRGWPNPFEGERKAVAAEFRQALRRLAELLSQPENHIMTESGQYEPIYDRERQYADVERQIANELANLPKYTARCKLSNGRGTEEVTIETLPLTAHEDPQRANRIRERSRRLYGRPRAEVEREIERRLRIKPPTTDEEPEPIFREKG